MMKFSTSRKDRTPLQQQEMITEEWDTLHTISGLPAPADWHIAERRHDGLLWDRLFGARLRVIESIAVETDRRRWLHVSVSKAPSCKMLTYEDLQVVRTLFIGEQRECYMVFPPKDRYVNINPVLHLFCCLDKPSKWGASPF